MRWRSGEVRNEASEASKRSWCGDGRSVRAGPAIMAGNRRHLGTAIWRAPYAHPNLSDREARQRKDRSVASRIFSLPHRGEIGREGVSIEIEGKLRRPVIRWLESLAMTPVFEVYCCGGTCDIVGCQWGERVGRFIPPLLRCIAVELKINDAGAVLNQAKKNRNRVRESYAAMPTSRVALMTPRTISKFKEAGVGLLSVGINSLDVAIIAVANLDADPNRLKQKLWRRRDEWTDRIDCQKFSIPKAKHEAEVQG